MAWNILLAYVVVTEVLLFNWVWSSFLFYNGTPSLLFEAGLSTASPLRKFSFYLVINGLMLIAAPFVVPFLFVYLANYLRREIAELRTLRRTFKELLLDPLHAGNMPEELAEYIEEHLPAATAMGFEILGDYWLKDAPYNSKARILLSADRLAFAEISVCLGQHFCELNSFLEDGSIIGTANVDCVRNTRKRNEKGWYLNGVGMKADMLETIEAHFKFVEEVSSKTNQPLRKISRENWKDYFQYNNQKYGQVRFELGETKTPPVKCEFPNESTSTTTQTELSPIG